MTYSDPSKRHDFVLLFDVTNGNPNGDPDADNYPRTDRETGHGLVSDVAIKRKIRDYANLHRDQPIFIQSAVSLNQRIYDAFRAIGVQPPETTLEEDLLDWFEEHAPEGFALEGERLIYGGESFKRPDIRKALSRALDEAGEEDKTLQKQILALADKLAANTAQNKVIGDRERSTARDQLCKGYYDIRMFGAVLQTGLNAGQVRGPVQVMFARSIDPVPIQDYTLTRNARTTAERLKTGSTEMGRKPQVIYGLYRTHGFYNPKFAEQTGVTEQDLEVLWDALKNLFEMERSASRGEMVVRGLYVFTHDNPLGNAPAHQLFRRIGVVRREGSVAPRSFEDYVVTVVEQQMPNGVTLERLVDEPAPASAV